MNYIQIRFYFSFAVGKFINMLPRYKCLSKTKVRFALWMIDVAAKTIDWKLKKELSRLDI